MGLAVRPRLLLVDDVPANRQVLAVLLGWKYTVSTHGSAAEALSAPDQQRPDLLVLNVGLTALDAVQALRAIRGRPAYFAVPAIAVTAFAWDVEKKSFLDAGFQAVVMKPILVAELVTVVDSLAERYVLAEAIRSGPVDVVQGGHEHTTPTPR